MMPFKLLEIWKIETLQDQLPNNIVFNGGDGTILCSAGEWDLITEYYYIFISCFASGWIYNIHQEFMWYLYAL